MVSLTQMSTNCRVGCWISGKYFVDWKNTLITEWNRIYFIKHLKSNDFCKDYREHEIDFRIMSTNVYIISYGNPVICICDGTISKKC